MTDGNKMLHFFCKILDFSWGGGIIINESLNQRFMSKMGIV